MSRFWQLPGPATFVNGSAEDLRQGRSIVFCLPECHPTGIYQEMRAALPSSDGWLWDRVDCSTAPAERPIDVLFERHAKAALPKAARNVWGLVQESSFWGMLFWLDGLTESTWPAWKQLLIEYASISRQRPRYERSAFCIPLTGAAALAPPPDDICISVRQWRGIVDSIDIMLYASMLLRADAASAIERRLAISLISGLALWDPLTCERLSGEPLHALMNPLPVLLDIAQEAGWHSELEPCVAWYRGMSNCFEGRLQNHSAILAVTGCQSELKSRIWKAEVTVVLPYLEERRRDVLAQYGASLRLPFTTRFGEVITDVYDLELAHIASLFAKDPSMVDFGTRRSVSRMAAVRNKLAHLNAIDHADLDVLS